MLKSLKNLAKHSNKLGIIIALFSTTITQAQKEREVVIPGVNRALTLSSEDFISVTDIPVEWDPDFKDWNVVTTPQINTRPQAFMDCEAEAQKKLASLILTLAKYQLQHELETTQLCEYEYTTPPENPNEQPFLLAKAKISIRYYIRALL